jgi:hypothetical protein
VREVGLGGAVFSGVKSRWVQSAVRTIKRTQQLSQAILPIRHGQPPTTD